MMDLNSLAGQPPKLHTGLLTCGAMVHDAKTGQWPHVICLGKAALCDGGYAIVDVRLAMTAPEAVETARQLLMMAAAAEKGQ